MNYQGKESVLNQKKKILISACLMGECCRYDGRHCRDERLVTAVNGFELIPVCPENSLAVF